ncbi:zinc finger, C2H2 type [Onchocerca flexuosa]|uniref:Zinc finger, C2H2 type n=1 Tax=Onchocerca flexuosa TaxID=387005 RepID=A0A238BR44_9BILA|nr:zinc finger, C2H2 type [Onchocerca flexuosa]
MFHTDKAFICEICGKAFRFRSNLAEHRSVHTALKPYFDPSNNNRSKPHFSKYPSNKLNIDIVAITKSIHCFNNNKSTSIFHLRNLMNHDRYHNHHYQ